MYNVSTLFYTVMVLTHHLRRCHSLTILWLVFCIENTGKGPHVDTTPVDQYLFSPVVYICGAELDFRSLSLSLSLSVERERELISCLVCEMWMSITNFQSLQTSRLGRQRLVPSLTSWWAEDKSSGHFKKKQNLPKYTTEEEVTLESRVMCLFYCL